MALHTILAIFLGDDLLESVISLRAHLHGLGKRGGTSREEHEFLIGEFVPSVFSTIDDVEGRAWHDVWFLDTSKGSKVDVKRDALFGMR